MSPDAVLPGRAAQGSPPQTSTADGEIQSDEIQSDEIQSDESGPDTAHPAEVDLSTVSPEGRRMLEVASVMGATFTVYDVAEVLGHPEGWLLRAVGEAVDAGLIVPISDSLAFRHEGVRQQVYESVPRAVRVALHRQIGSLLLAGGGRAADAAEHLGKGVELGDRRSLAKLDDAVAKIRASSPGWAADLSMRALELTEPSSPTHDYRLANAVEALAGAGRVDEAARLGHALLARRCGPGTPLSIPVGRTSVAMSAISLSRHDSAEALRYAESVLGSQAMPADICSAAELARFLAVIDQGQRTRLRHQVEEVLAGGDQPVGDAAMAGATIALSALAWDEGRPAEALGFLEAAIRRAERMPRPRHPYPRLALAARLTALGRFGQAESLIAASAYDIEEDGVALWSAAPTILRARLQLARADLDAALVDAEAGVERAEELGTSLFVPLGRTIMAAIAVLRGDLRSASTHLGDEIAGHPALEHGADIGEHPTGFGPEEDAEVSPAIAMPPSALAGAALQRWVDLRLLEARDGPATAMAKFGEIYDNRTDLLPLVMEEPTAAAWLTRVALASDDGDRASGVVDAVEQLATANPGMPSLAAAGAHARGVLEGDHAGLLAASGNYRDPWSAASAAEDAGAALMECADRTGARAALEKAFTGYERVGAERDLARVRARLRAVGVRRCHWSHESRPVSGWGSLTDTEMNVASLVAEGLTNPQVAERMFLSRHTVDFHLRQIFRKLGIDSRVALTRMMLEQGKDRAAGTPTGNNGR